MDTIAVLGGGNGGQATAGFLGQKGYTVKMYDIFEENINKINEQNGIYLTGFLSGFGKVECATGSIEECVKDAQTIIIVTPAFAHKKLATQLAPILTEKQRVLLHPGSTFGALEFKQTLVDEGCHKHIVISEAISLLFVARLEAPGTVHVGGLKENLAIATFPSVHSDEAVQYYHSLFSNIDTTLKNTIESGLSNLNTIVHPLPTLLNTSLIESKHEWLYYLDGITPSIGDMAFRLDKERLSLGEKFHFELIDVRGMYKMMYNSEGETLTEICRNTLPYAKVKGQKDIQTRYLLEDIPMGIIPMASLAAHIGLAVPIMQVTIQLAELLLNKDLHENARTVDSIGIGTLSIDEILHYVTTGEK